MKAYLYRIILHEAVHILDEKYTQDQSFWLYLNYSHMANAVHGFMIATYLHRQLSNKRLVVTASSTGIKKPGVSCENTCIEL